MSNTGERAGSEPLSYGRTAAGAVPQRQQAGRSLATEGSRQKTRGGAVGVVSQAVATKSLRRLTEKEHV